MILAAASRAALPVIAAGDDGNKPLDPVKVLVGRLDLEKYKATIKGLTRSATAAKERIAIARRWIGSKPSSRATVAQHLAHQVHTIRPARPAGPAGRRSHAGLPPSGGGRYRGRARPDGRQRRSASGSPTRSCARSNSQPTEPGEREEVYCTKVGSTHPEEMYIVGAHMDGHGWGEAANDDGSGTALVMELARVSSSPDVKTERSIRFALWNNEETGLNGARAYVDQRAALQGKEEPAGSGRVSRTEVVGDDSARHDAVRSRHAARRWHGIASSSGRRRT